MENNMLIELLYEKVKLLEKRIEALEQNLNNDDVAIKSESNNDSKIYREFPIYASNIKKLIQYFDIVFQDYKGEVELGLDELNKLMELQLTNDEMDDLALVTKLHKVSDYFLVSSFSDVYAFAKKRIKVKQIGKHEIQAYIENLIRNSNDEYIEITALEVHKKLNLESRMPSVCAAMDSLFTENDTIVSGKNPSSTYKIRYKKR